MKDQSYSGLTCQHLSGGASSSTSATLETIADTGTRAPFLDSFQHGERLRERGFTVIPEPVLDVALVESARELSKARLAQLLEDVRGVGCDPVEQQYRFREIATRQRNRWDLQLEDPAQGPGDTTWSRLCRAAVAAATPIIREAQGGDDVDVEPVMIGAVISRPG